MRTSLNIIWFLALLGCSPAILSQTIFDAVTKGDVPLTRKLLAQDPASLQARNEDGRTSLHLAAACARKEIVALLLAHGADVNAADAAGRTAVLQAATSVPFGYSVAQERKDTVRLLVDAGAAFPVSGPECQKLIHIAASSGYELLAERMISAGADLTTKSRDGGTLLHSAATGGLARIIDILILRGADANSLNRYGLTPLHLAAMLGKRDAVLRLLAGGAGINARCPAGKTALNCADEAGFREIVDELGRKGAARTPPRFPDLTGPYLGQKKPGRAPEIFAPGIISTIFVEHSPPVFSPNGTELYWSPLIVRNQKAGSTILSMAAIHGRWMAPQPIAFSGNFMDAFPTLSPDAQLLYFCSDRPVRADMPAEHRNIWVAQKKAVGWSDPRPAGLSVNSGNENTQSTVDNKGNLYFGSARNGRNGSFDIYVSRLIQGRHAEPENLGPSINSAGLEYSPFVDPSGQYLIFCAGERTDSLGAMDLYVSFRNADGSWGKAINLGDRINTPADEYWPAVSPDGKYLFFISNRDGNFDVYWVDGKIIESAKGGAR